MKKLKALLKRIAIYAVIVISAIVMTMLYFEITSYIRHKQRDKARATRCISAVLRLATAEKLHYAEKGKFAREDILVEKGYVSKAEMKSACEAPLKVEIEADGEGFLIEAKPKNRFRETCLIRATQDGTYYNEEPGYCWPRR